MTTTTRLPPPRFALHELVQVPHLGAACIGRIESCEDGRNLKDAMPSWAYRVQPPGIDGEYPEPVIVAEGDLRGLTEDAENEEPAGGER